VAITLEAGVSLGAMPIFRFGTEEQKREWLPELCAGTKPGRVRADRARRRFGRRRHPHHSGVVRRRRYRLRVVINGSKSFITNSGTDITSAVTVTGGDRNQRQSQGDLGDHRAGRDPRVHRGPKYSKVGWNASDTHELSFDDCRVPAANLLGERGKGYAQFLRILDEGRIAIAAVSVGLARLRGRVPALHPGAEAFGHTIGTYQSIQFKMADMEVRAHTARLAYYHAASKLLRGEPFKKDAAIAKLVASNAGDGQRSGRYADLRRLRVHERVPGRPVLPGRQDLGNRRGHVRGAAHAHRPRDRRPPADP